MSGEIQAPASTTDVDLLTGEDLPEPLPFSERKQEAVLGHLLANPRFQIQAVGKLPPEAFLDKNAATIWKHLVAFYRKYKKCPSPEEVKSFREILEMDAAVRNRLHSLVDLAVVTSKMFHLEPLRAELTEWLKLHVYKSQMQKSAVLWNNKQEPKAIENSRGMIRLLDRTSFEDDRETSFNDYNRFFEEQEHDYADALTFGNSMFDKKLTPKAASGSLLLGDTTILLAPTNIGKSTAMITTIMHNIKRRKPVLWLVHEGRVGDLQAKMWCAMLDCSLDQLFEAYKSPQGRAILDLARDMMDRYLTFIPMQQPGLTAEEVDVVIQRRFDEWAANHNGEGYAMVADDYPAKLITEMAKGGRMEKRAILAYVYNYQVQRALDYRYHSLLAIQTNREGSKVNRNDSREEKQPRLLMMEDVAECFDAMQLATTVISINRDPIAEAKNYVTFYQCKSRSSEKGWACCCRSNFGHAITHSDELGAVCYRGTSTMSDRVDDLLRTQPNTTVAGQGL